MRPIAKELMLEGLQATVKFDGEVVPPNANCYG
jgi:hypothetical protein